MKVKILNNLLSGLCTVIAALVGIVILAQPSAIADPFVPINGELKDRAFLFELESGTRRVRMQVRDVDSTQWKTYSMAHLRGDEMFFKVRIPDDVDVSDCRIHVSQTDPFPYSYYEGRTTTFLEEEGKSSPTSLSSTTRLSSLDGIQMHSSAMTGGVLASYVSAGNSSVTAGENSTDVVVNVDEVVESDIWQWNGATLYFFNQLRGLQVIDVSDSKNPIKKATLRMPAAGDQIYLLDDEYIVLLARRWDYHWAWGTSRGSEVVVIRHKDDQLSVVNRVPLDGTLIESRMVGSRLYTVSQVTREIEDEVDNTFNWRNSLEVRSLDLKEPTDPQSLDPLTLSSEDQGYYWDAVVTASANYVFVAPSYYDEESRNTRSRVIAIPIGSNVEKLEIAHEIELESQILDKFKLHESGGVLIAVSQQNRRSNRNLKTFVESFDLTRPAGGEIGLDTLELAPRERLHATRFYRDRLYVVTFLVPVRKDPLFVIDISDPSAMKVDGELEVPGWANYLEPLSDSRLLAVGEEDDRVAVSLYDVENTRKPKQLSRIFPGKGRTHSEANFDEKAFNYLDSEGLALLPVRSTADNENVFQMHLIDVETDKLTERGAIQHEFAGRRATAIGDHVVSISQNKLLTVDISNRDEPVIAKTLPLAWTADRVVEFEDYSIQIDSGVRSFFFYSRPGSSAAGRLHITAANDPETAISELNLPEGDIIGSAVDDDFLYLAASVLVQERDGDEPDAPMRWANLLRTIAIDLSDPSRPRVADVSDHRHKDGSYYRYSELNGAILSSGALLWYPHVENNAHSVGWGWNYWGFRGYVPISTSFLGAARYLGPVYSFVSEIEAFAYDITDSSNIELLSHTAIRPKNLAKIGKSFLNGDRLMLSFKASEHNGRNYANQYFVQEVKFEDPAHPQKSDPVNVPGLLEGLLTTSSDQAVLFTTVPKFRGSTQLSYQTSNSLLQASVYDGTNAFLANEISVEDGRYTPTITTGRYVVKSFWDREFEGLKVYAWSLLEGGFAEVGTIDLGHVPESLHLRSELLFAQSGDTLSVIPVDQLLSNDSSITVDWPGFRYATYLHRLTVNSDRSTARIPTGAYGVEELDLTELGLDEVPRVMALNGDTWSEFAQADALIVVGTGRDAVGSLDHSVPFGSSSRFHMTPGQWSFGYFNPPNDSVIAVPGWDEDVDFDGFSNLEEYLFATDPVSRSSIPRVVASNTEGTVSIQYSLSSTALDSVEARLEFSEDLEHWQDLGAEQWLRTDLASGMTLIEVGRTTDQDGYVRMGFWLQD